MNHHDKANLFGQLAALERAGMPPDRAFRTLATDAPPRVRPSLIAASSLAARGQGLAVIGLRTGLFDRVDVAVLDAASTGGKVEQAYRLLAERHRRADARSRRIRGRLLLPGFVLLAAAFIRPFPAFFLGELGFAAYLAAALGPVALVAGVAFLSPPLWARLRETSAGDGLRVLALRLPLLATRETRRNRMLYLEALAMLIEAGVPAIKALEIAADMVPNPSARAAFAEVWAAVKAGSPIAHAFADCSWMDSRSSQLVLAGETSGSLDSMLERLAAMAAADFEELEDLLATWLPRVAYVLVGIWIVSGLDTNAFAPKVPDDL